MINASNIIDCVIYGRYYKFNTNSNGWLVYESLNEEGGDVKKKLGQFSSQEKADEFISEMEVLLRVFLTKTLNISKAVINEECNMPVAKDVLQKLREREQENKSKKRKKIITDSDLCSDDKYEDTPF